MTGRAHLLHYPSLRCFDGLLRASPLVDLNVAIGVTNKQMAKFRYAVAWGRLFFPLIDGKGKGGKARAVMEDGVKSTKRHL
jgi:hypothetical protein